MEYHGYAGGAVHSHSVPALGGLERVEAEEDGERRYYGHGEWTIWECEWCGCCRGDDPAGCAEDAYDVVEGEDPCRGIVGEDIEGEWAESFLCWDGAEDFVD